MEPISRASRRIRLAARAKGSNVSGFGNFRFDEIGRWSELKLEIVEKYGAAYTKAFSERGKGLRKYYIDAFSGAGVHVSKETGLQIDGSPARALKVRPPFDHFYFIDLNPIKTAYLKSLCADRNDVDIITGDATVYLTRKLLPTIRFKKFNRALCLLDPYGLHLDWEVLRQAGQSQAVDMFLNFPVMDMNRNAIWRNPGLAPQDGIERMSRFWGDETWKQAAYAESPQYEFFALPGRIKQDNDAVVAKFRERLKKVAGFSFVPEPLPMRNSNNAVVYYLFFASPKPVAERIIESIFAKYR
jgi:three-Cys-motif partner protein